MENFDETSFNMQYLDSDGIFAEDGIVVGKGGISFSVQKIQGSNVTRNYLIRRMLFYYWNFTPSQTKIIYQNTDSGNLFHENTLVYNRAEVFEFSYIFFSQLLLQLTIFRDQFAEWRSQPLPLPFLAVYL